MITYRIASEKVPVQAFEVSVIETGIRRLAKLLKNTPGVSNVTIRRPFSSSRELISFAYKNTDFIVCEPFGDSSRYWIGPVAMDGKSEVDLSCIEQVFAHTPVSIIRSLAAKIFT